jgi:hypothetical protein
VVPGGVKGEEAVLLTRHTLPASLAMPPHHPALHPSRPHVALLGPIPVAPHSRSSLVRFRERQQGWGMGGRKKAREARDKDLGDTEGSIRVELGHARLPEVIVRLDQRVVVRLRLGSIRESLRLCVQSRTPMLLGRQSRNAARRAAADAAAADAAASSCPRAACRRSGSTLRAMMVRGTSPGTAQTHTAQPTTWMVRYFPIS